jgi:hypothetical protein
MLDVRFQLLKKEQTAVVQGPAGTGDSPVAARQAHGLAFCLIFRVYPYVKKVN